MTENYKAYGIIKQDGYCIHVLAACAISAEFFVSEITVEPENVRSQLFQTLCRSPDHR